MALPKGWRTATLGEVARWGSGGTPTATNAAYYGGQIPWAVIGDLNDATVSVTAKTITELGLRGSSAKLIPAGSILVAMYGSIGKLGIAGKVMATNQAIAFAQPDSSLVTARFLFWWLMYQRPRLVHAGKGATQQNISQQVLKSWPIVLPPVAEQERIVGVLEAIQTDIDAAVEYLRSAWVRIGQLRRVAYTYGRSSGYPEVSLAELVRAGRPICYGILKPRVRTGGTVPYVELKDIVRGSIRADGLHKTSIALHREYARSTLSAGDVVIAIRGSFGRTAVVPAQLEGANLSRDVARVSPGPDVIPEYLALALESPSATRFFKAQARGVGVQGVNIRDLKQIKIPLPSIQEQRLIVERASRWLQGEDRLRGEISAAFGRARALRASVLYAAFTGALPLARALPQATAVDDELVVGASA